jgi:predicted negative regulator of RcsB-dependent stress response
MAEFDDTLEELKQRFRKLAQPLVDSVDARVDDHLEERIKAVVEPRLAVLERAIADLDRAVKALEAKER